MGCGKTFLPAQWFGIGQFHGFKAAYGYEKARHVGRRAGRCVGVVVGLWWTCGVGVRTLFAASSVLCCE